MKCRLCGHRVNVIANMSRHYRKAHPGAMTSRRARKSMGGDTVAFPTGPMSKVTPKEFGRALSQIADIIKAGGKVVFE